MSDCAGSARSVAIERLSLSALGIIGSVHFPIMFSEDASLGSTESIFRNWFALTIKFMTHSEKEMLKFGAMVVGMITDAITVRKPGEHAYGSRRVTIGEHASHVFVIAGDDLAEKVHEFIRTVDIVSSVQMSEKLQ